MYKNLSWPALVLGITLGGAPACHHCGRHCATPPPPPPTCCPPGAGQLPPHPLAPYQANPYAGPGGPSPAYGAPPPPPPGNPNFNSGPPSAPPPPAPLTDTRGYGPANFPPTEDKWHAPANPGNQSAVPQAAPESSTAEPPRANVFLKPPEAPAGSPAPVASSPQPEGAAALSPLPVGIPQFTEARAHVTAGLTPSEEGLDWLKAKGYQTVLHLKQPGENDLQERAMVERRNIHFLSLEVSPEKLSRDLIQEFNRTVTLPANQPVFVYDRDGTLSGAIWYLHFRAYDRATDAEARTRAVRLGLKEDAEGPQKSLWLAIQKVLSTLAESGS